jgi:hypothetical protein
MKSGTARRIFYHLIRWLFLVSAASLALVFLITVVVAVFDPTIPGAWANGFVIVLIGGFAGLFSSVACANFVRCPGCGKKALVFPDNDPTAPENLHQPWRRTCGRCSTELT